MSDTAIARAYATALFEAAEAADSVAPTGDDLRAFVHALDESRGAGQRGLQPADRARSQGARARAASWPTATVSRPSVLGVLLDKGRISLAGDVADEYERFVSQAAKVVEVEVTTAVPVGPDVERLIVERVRRSTGGEPRLDQTGRSRRSWAGSCCASTTSWSTAACGRASSSSTTD